MEVFQDYAYYYNTFYNDKDYKAEALQVDRILNNFGRNISEIMNFGCGTGKHDIELSKIGYRCAGIDVSSRMIEAAQQNAEKEKLNIEFSVADIRKYKGQKKYDAVISLFHVMSYQTSNQDIKAAFCAAREVLSVGGIFLFDVWYGSGVLSDKPAVRVKEIEKEDMKLIRIARPVLHEKRNIADIHYNILAVEDKTGKTETVNEVHTMRYFFRPELELLLEHSGFELLDNIDCKTLGETSFESWTSYFIARAV